MLSHARPVVGKCAPCMLTRNAARPHVSFLHDISAKTARTVSTSRVNLAALRKDEHMEDMMHAATTTRRVPGAVLLAADRTGDFTYHNVFGVRSIADDEPLTMNSTMWIASCTKLVTSIAAMQCVERGLISLDEDVRPVLHELQNVDIIESDEAGNIVSRRNQAPITLRQLLTHTSGYCYEFNSPILQQWRKKQTESAPMDSVHNRFSHPLLYVPGTSWTYGPSIDWAGVLVERVSHSPSLEAYMKQNIWDPLGIRDMTFFLSRRPDLQARRVNMAFRPNDQSEVVPSKGRNPSFEPDMEDAQGGGGIFCDVSEYFKIICALLRATDTTAPDVNIPPAQLVQRSTANAMFEPQLGEESRAALMAFTNIPQVNHMMSNLPLGTAKDHALGGMVQLEDLPNWRRKGTLTWGGTPNLTWFIDRHTGLAGLYASQLMPIGDPKTNELLHVFEKTIYERYSEYQRQSQ